jgi:hypothetical protein
MKTINYKVPGGKMLKIKITIQGKIIETVTILGDFFLHPESTIEVIEERIRGCNVDVGLITSEIQKVLDNEKAVLIGVNALDIAKAIEKASNA